MRGLRCLSVLAFVVFSVGGTAYGSTGASTAPRELTAAGAAHLSASVPPVPSCFRKPGICNGTFTKPGKLPIRRVEPKADGIYTFSWKPLQTKTPVGNGDLGSVYNYLSWLSGAGTVVSGCQPNDASCTIKVYPGYGWLPVAVIQNSYEQAFWVVYSPPVETAPVPSTASLVVAVSSQRASVEVGRSLPVTVRVTATGGAVSSIGLGNGLSSSTASATVTASPSGLNGFSLAKGASRAFVFAVKGAGPGATVLTIAASGRSSSGRAARGSGSLKVVVGGKVLSIAVETSPEPLALKAGKNGLITPGEITVTARVTNVSGSPVDHVQLLSLDPVPKDLSQKLDKLAFPHGTFPVKFPGSFAPGSHATRTFKLEVTGDGEYQFRALALYDNPSAPGGNGRVFAVVGGFKAVVPLLTFTSTLHRDGISDRNGTDWVKGGTSWYVGGQIKNLSATKSICVAPLGAQTDGNSASVGLQDVSLHNVSTAEPPFAGLLKPGQSIPLGMAVITSPLGTTQGSVDVPVTGFVAAAGATCELEQNGAMSGAGAILTTDQTDIPAGSTSFVVHVDVTATPPPLPPNAGGLEFFGRFAKSSFDFYADTALGLAALAKSTTDPLHYRKAILGFGIYDPIVVAERVGEANAEIMSTSRLLVNFLQTASPAQQQAVYDFASQVAARVPNAAYAKLVQETEVVGKQWFGKLLAAVESGDADQIWGEWAGLAGEGFGKLNAVWLQLFIEGAGVQLAARSTELEAVAKAETANPAVLTSSKGVAAGRVLKPVELAKTWGFPKAVVDKMNEIANTYPVLIGARSRQAISIELENLGAVWKNSNFHQKTVNAIDRLYLRMGKIRQGLLGARSFTAAGTSQAINEIKAAGLPAAEEAEALARVADRIHESEADLTKLKQLATTRRRACSTCPETEGWVNAGFNANESGAIAASTSVSRWRRFELVETKILSADGHTVLGTLYEPFEENVVYASYPKLGKSIPELCHEALGTVLCPITGDIDLVYITDLFGRSLGPTLMREVFGALEAAGFAHTDLVTWYDQQESSFFFPGKEKQLENLTVGKDSAVQFSPDGVNRATYLAPMNQSISTGPNNYQLTIIGGANPATR